MKTIGEFRDRFKRVPLGRWSSLAVFDPLEHHVWEFFRDGMARLTDHSGSGVQLVFFEWSPQAERAINLREVRERDWMSVSYDFKLQPGVVPEIVMFEVPEDEVLKFVWTLDYLRFEGGTES